MRFFASVFCFSLLLAPGVLLAQGQVYAPLVDLSNAAQGNNLQSFEGYINFLYGLSIAVAALLATIKIVIAGAKYMFSDVIPDKGQALADIQGSILGLLLILSAVIILELINPNLVDTKITFDGDFQSSRPAPPPVTTEPDNAACITKTARTICQSEVLWQEYDLSSCTDRNKSFNIFMEQTCAGSSYQSLGNEAYICRTTTACSSDGTPPGTTPPGNSQPPVDTFAITDPKFSSCIKRQPLAGSFIIYNVSCTDVKAAENHIKNVPCKGLSVIQQGSNRWACRLR